MEPVAVSALSDVLNQHIQVKYGNDVSNRELARKSGGALSRATIDKYRRGDHGTPSPEILLAFHSLTGAPLTEMRTAAGMPAGERDPWKPPVEADLMNRRQRKAVTELIRSMVLLDQEVRREELAAYLRQAGDYKDTESAIRRARERFDAWRVEASTSGDDGGDDDTSERQSRLVIVYLEGPDEGSIRIVNRQQFEVELPFVPLYNILFAAGPEMDDTEARAAAEAVLRLKHAAPESGAKLLPMLPNDTEPNPLEGAEDWHRGDGLSDVEHGDQGA